MNSFFGDAELFSPSMIGYFSKVFFSLLERLEFTPAASATNKRGYIRTRYTYLVRIQNFLFHFPFDEIYRRLFFLVRSVSA